MSAKDTAQTMMANLPTIIDNLEQAKQKSLIEYSQPLRVQPTALIDARAAQLPYIDEVMHTILNVFTGYYLQAVSLSANVGNLEVLKVLDKLSPNRDPMGEKLRSESLESIDEFTLLPGGSLPEGYYSQEDKGGGDRKQANETAELSVGKIVEVTITSNDKEAKFPVMIRIHSQTVRPDTMSHTLTINSQDEGFKERYHQWRAGQLRFFKDLILAQDLIDNYRKAIADDKTNYHPKENKKRNKNLIASALSRNISVARASSIFVMTKKTAREFEEQFRGSLSRFRDREQFFRDVNGMLLVVVDPDWEQVTIYHRSIDEPSEVSVQEIQRSHSKSRGNGPDMLEILNAFRQRQAPSSF